MDVLSKKTQKIIDMLASFLFLHSQVDSSVYFLRIYAYHFLKISSIVNIQTRSLMLLKWRFTETCYDLEKSVAAKL